SGAPQNGRAVGGSGTVTKPKTYRSRGRLARYLAVAALAVSALAMGASSAHGAFPGANGRIAFSRCEDGTDCKVGAIWTMNADGSSPTRLFSDPGYWDDDPAFSSDGRKIAFQRCVVNGACGIATADAFGNGLHQLTTGATPIG